MLPEKDPNGPRASIQDFYAELSEAKDVGYSDPGTQEFIHCLVASADYDSFYSVMVREALKLDQAEAQAKIAGSINVGPSVAEAKGGAAEPKGGKGTDDDDDDDDKGYK